VWHPAFRAVSDAEAIMSPAAPMTVRAARAIHRALLILVPADVRRRYRAEMVATFETASAEAGARGVGALARLLCAEVRDLATSRRANRPAPVILETSGRHTSESPSPWLQPLAWRQAWRSLKRRPAYLAATVLTLGAGAGITTAVFSLVDTVLIKPLPYPDADRLVTVFESSPSEREKTSLIAPARLEDWQRLTRSFVALSGSYTENVTDTSGREPERLEGRRVSPRFFDVFGTPPLAGRFFTADEERANGPGAAIISERFWVRRYQRDAAAIGRVLTIGGRPHVIVGVMPASFTNATTDVWLPAQLSPQLMQIRAARFLGGVGRIRPGVTFAAAAQDLAAVQSALAREFPQTDAGWSAEIASLKEARIGGARRGLVMVFGAVAALWAIAVANIAGLSLVQVRRRSREMAIRTALGASRMRVAATMIREGLLIGLAGSVVGSALATWLVSLMPTMLAGTARINELAIDWRALAFATATSLLAVCAFSLLPALVGTRQDANRVIGSGRSVAGGHHLLQKALVVGQVALSVVLVGSATLLLRSYYNLTHVETGFDSSSVVTFHVGARWDEDRTRIGQLQEQLITRLHEMPYVQAAGFTNFLPATGATLRYQVLVEGLSGSNADGSFTVGMRTIAGQYLRAISAPLLAGASCPDLVTSATAPASVIVNRRFIDAHAAGQNLVGRTLRVTQFPGSYTIRGIVGDLAEDGRASSPAPYVYTCGSPGAWPDPEYVARTSDATAFASDLRRIVRELDSGRAVFGLRPLQEVLDAALDRPRLDAAMLGVFAAAAVILAAVGLYSLFMLVVSDRMREIAVRLAIGAEPSEMIRMVMSGAGRLLTIGIVAGIALTAAADRVLRGVLFGVGALDIPALTAAALTLAVVAAVAVLGPALKAARVEPTVVLRGD
jgi:putative ABC transport system permease protein